MAWCWWPRNIRHYWIRTSLSICGRWLRVRDSLLEVSIPQWIIRNCSSCNIYWFSYWKIWTLIAISVHQFSFENALSNEILDLCIPYCECILIVKLFDQKERRNIVHSKFLQKILRFGCASLDLFFYHFHG